MCSSENKRWKVATSFPFSYFFRLVPLHNRPEGSAGRPQWCLVCCRQRCQHWRCLCGELINSGFANDRCMHFVTAAVWSLSLTWAEFLAFLLGKQEPTSIAQQMWNIFSKQAFYKYQVVLDFGIEFFQAKGKYWKESANLWALIFYSKAWG